MEIFLLHYPEGNRMEFSIGLIKNLNDFNIRHTCDSSAGSSGSPIINAINFQVIGIHKGGEEGAKNYNFGTLLKETLQDFKNENIKDEDIEEDKNKRNERKMKNKIDEDSSNVIMLDYQSNILKIGFPSSFSSNITPIYEIPSLLGFSFDEYNDEILNSKLENLNINREEVTQFLSLLQLTNPIKEWFYPKETK